MKLYTEEQVAKAIRLAQLRDQECGGVYYYNYTETEVMEELTPIELFSDMLCVNCDESKPTHNICMECIISIGQQNIELPSDAEIVKVALDLAKKYRATTEYEISALEIGAKWMRDKIGGNNEQR